ncbi:transcriptional regulator, ArsR family [Psychrobacter arcticus 273-4]|uniref:Transcriptional regulator, ArsR family n=1 Tax=Psychrobacter arcticus (strain DSM 17307 / VKM B-2377 / 273-4) TaxID=259536 RepID=Q4FT53_PSYA2|nr:helix-turn-helix transcriptional regulator [Psychrobacter arcticus]AAZ18805.1 transcriptional regulator, ArsR family [Psychrobacter arcticus 273-4]
MEITHAITSFAALSQDTRLKAFRLLVSHEPKGLAAGEIARQLSVPHNTMSTHLAVLARAGWVISERQSRQIIYRASLSHMQSVIEFLLQDCCAGNAELCAALVDNLNGCPTDQLDNDTDNQRNS